MADTVEFWDYPISIKQLHEIYGVTPDEINELNDTNYTEDYFFTGGASILLPSTKVKFQTSPTGQPTWIKVGSSSDPVFEELQGESTTYREAGQHRYVASNPPSDTGSFLKQWWVEEGYDSLFYDEERAKEQFIQYWEEQLKRLSEVQRGLQMMANDTSATLSTDLQWLQNDQSIMDYFAPLVAEQGMVVLPQAFMDAYSYLDGEHEHFTYGEENPILLDAMAYLNAHASEQGQPLPYDLYANYDDNLAYEYYIDQVLDDAYSDEGGYLGLILGMLGDADPEVIASLIASSPDAALWQAMSPYIGQPLNAVAPMVEYWGSLSLEEQLTLASSIADQYQVTATDMDKATDPADYVLDQTREQTLEFLDQQTLDQLRTMIFDPEWHPDALVEKLNRLNGEIAKMETAILGVDITWVKQSFQTYHDNMVNWLPTYSEWREKMRPGMEQIELEMLGKEEDELSPFWWLEIVGAVLFEPIDWLLTARDLMSGDMGALVGLLPMIPASIRNIADAGRYATGATADLIWKHLGDSDEFQQLFLDLQGKLPKPELLPPSSVKLTEGDLKKMGLRNRRRGLFGFGEENIDKFLDEQLQVLESVDNSRGEFSVFYSEDGKLLVGFRSNTNWVATPFPQGISSHNTHQLHTHPIIYSTQFFKNPIGKNYYFGGRPYDMVLPGPSFGGYTDNGIHMGDIHNMIGRNSMSLRVSDVGKGGNRYRFTVTREVDTWGVNEHNSIPSSLQFKAEEGFRQGLLRLPPIDSQVNWLEVAQYMDEKYIQALQDAYDSIEELNLKIETIPFFTDGN